MPERLWQKFRPSTNTLLWCPNGDLRNESELRVYGWDGWVYGWDVMGRVIKSILQFIHFGYIDKELYLRVHVLKNCHE